jgi:SRSO17 transposase
MRDLVRAEVVSKLGDAAGVLVVDETGFVKKGTHSVVECTPRMRQGKGGQFSL